LLRRPSPSFEWLALLFFNLKGATVKTDTISIGAVAGLILGAVIEFSVVDGINTWQVATGLADLRTTETIPQACTI
jgi:hypothetical protein